MSLALAVYRAVTGLLEPLAPSLLKRRVRAGKEDAARLPERLGRSPTARPPRLQPLDQRQQRQALADTRPMQPDQRPRRPDLPILVTSGTVASAEMMGKRLPEGVIHQFSPVDAPGAAGRFIAHWRPALAVFVESELWPNLILEAKRRDIALVVEPSDHVRRTLEITGLTGTFDLR